MVKDLVPLVTPNDVLTDALNATLITYNGNEFQLQNDMGNVKVERAKLPVNFVPIGMKEYGGIIYIVAYNPETGEGEIGSFPSPERDFSTTDFEGIQPVNFDTADFKYAQTPNDTEKTFKIGKLFEPELFNLSPGDMYVITYNIKPVPPATEQIVDTPTMNDFISSVEARKLFELAFYKVTDDNSLIKLDIDTVNVIEDEEDLEDKYSYFKENSQSVIAVGMELENLDYFQTNVIDTSRKTDSNKKVALEAIGYSESLADFNGVRVDVFQPTPDTFYLERTGSPRKVSATVDGLSAGDIFSGEITPYSKYGLFPKLKKDFQVTIGEFISAGTGVNDIFQYYTTDNFVKVDFDFKFEGDNPQGLYLYVEFYDPWSDYSVIKVVDNPTFYGINSVTLELINEPTSNIFTSTNIGGTPSSVLSVNPDTTYNKTLLNSTNLIRNTAVLRRNHFYIVRVSGVDVDLSSGTAQYTHYDFYKGLYTNKLLNGIYEGQATLPVNNPSYIADFNTVRLRVEDMVTVTDTILDNAPKAIKVGTKWYESDMNYPPASPDPINLPESISQKPYTISPSDVPEFGYYEVEDQYQVENSVTVTTALSGLTNVFGTLKGGIVEVDVDPIQPVAIEDNGYIPETGISYPDPLSPKSTVSQSIDTSIPDKITFNRTLNSYRNIFSPRSKRIGEDIFSNSHYDLDAAPYFVKHSSDMNVRPNQLSRGGPVSGWPNNGNPGGIYNIVQTSTAGFPGPGDIFNQHGAWFPVQPNQPRPVFINTRMQVRRNQFQNQNSYKLGNYDGDTVGFSPNNDQGGKYGGFTVDWVRRGDGYYWCMGINQQTYNKLITPGLFMIHSVVSGNKYIYYASPIQTKYNGTVTTVANFTGTNYNVNYNSTVKTYLSNIKFRALGTSDVEFNTQTINDYIESRKGGSTIVDSKDTITDGFIPYIDYSLSTVKEITTRDLTISAAADAGIVNQFQQASTSWNQDPSLNPNDTRVHGKIYAKNAVDNNIASAWTAEVPTSTQATYSNTKVYINDENKTRYNGGGWYEIARIEHRYGLGGMSLFEVKQWS